MTNNEQFQFQYSTQVINPEGKLVYEYNPLYNYRVDRDVYSKDAEGNLLDKQRNVLTKAEADITDDLGNTIHAGEYYYSYKENGQTNYVKSSPYLEENGVIQDLITGGFNEGFDDKLGFDLSHPVEIACQQSYDGSTNLILNDGKNIPRLINTRFTPLENNTYKRVDRRGNTDTNLYDYGEFEIDTSLFKRYNSIPIIQFQKVIQGGSLKIGNYTFYFKLADADGNETDFVGESGIVTLHIGALNSPQSIRGGSLNENSNKSVIFTLTKIDSAYDYVIVYYTRTTGDNTAGTQTVTAHKITKKYRTLSGLCSITITGDEDIENIDVSEINSTFFVASSAKTQTICQNRLFLGNVTKSTIDYQTLQRLSLQFYPFYLEAKQDALIGCVQFDYTDAFGSYEYYNTQNIYNFVGYWPEEMYRFGVVYIMNDNTLSPVFNIRGIKELPQFTEDIYKYITGNIQEGTNPENFYTNIDDIIIDEDTKYIDEATLENSAGVVQFPNAHVNVDSVGAYDGNKDATVGNLPVYGLKIVPRATTLEELEKYGVKGYFFVRQKRIPTILAQAFVMGIDKQSGLPLVYEGNDDEDDLYAIESFVTNQGKLEGELEDRTIIITKAADQERAAICPEFELDQAYYNNYFTGSDFIARPVTDQLDLCVENRHFYSNWNNSMKRAAETNYTFCNIIGVPDNVPAIRHNEFTFRSRAGNAEDITYEYVWKEESDNNIPIKDNFSHEKRKKHSWLKILKVTAIAVGVAAVAIGASYFTAGALAGVATGIVGKFVAGALVTSELAWGGAAVGIGIAGASAIAAGSAMKNSYSKGTGNYTDNRVRIVRGAYGPYLGLTQAKELKPNTLINIYAPGYLSQSPQDYFNVRIADESPFYAISKRYQLGRDDMTEDVFYRGDCYISTFTHRINRNFQDPDAPNNEKIVDENTWIDNWDKDKKQTSEVNRGDVNAVKMGMWITFKCYTSRNLAMRDWDAHQPTEEALIGHKRSFYPLSAMSVHGNNKVPDSVCYNAGFTVSVSNKVNFLMPNVPYIKDTYQTRIMYSNPAPTDAFKNGLREFNLVSYRDYPNQYGGLMRLVTWKQNIIAVFEHAIALIPVNERTLLSATTDQIAVGAAKIIPDSLTVISSDYGAQWPESVCVTPYAVYGLDTIAKKIWKTDGQTIETISDFKVQKFLNDNITLSERELTPIIGIRNVKTHYNAFKKDVMFTYYDDKNGFEEVAWNLCYNEIAKVFTSFYSWIPSYSANIDNMFFSYDRNSSKWIAKLGASNTLDNSCADGICFGGLGDNTLGGVNIDLWERQPTIMDSGKPVHNVYVQKIDVKNRILPKNAKSIIKTFTIERDNFRNDQYFGITDEGLIYITRTNMLRLLDKLLKTEPQIPVVQLNVKCNLLVNTESMATNSGDWKSWERYLSYNYGNYESQVALTFSKILDKGEHFYDGIAYPKLRTDFWKHGQAGLIDVQDKIKPCFWYGKQHPFEIEFIVGNDSALYKQFTNFSLISNNVLPESIHYTIIGDTYNFANDKKNMYFRQEATKALYQYNGSDILYDHDALVDITPEIITSSKYIEKDSADQYLRGQEAVSDVYKASIFPLLYSRQDTFNEVEDYYKTITAPRGKDYPNLVGCELIRQEDLDSYELCNHVKVRDVNKVGISRGNARYRNDRWEFQISPIALYQRNEKWVNDVPPLLLYNIPQNIYIDGFDIPEELKNAGYKYPVQLDTKGWNSIANNRKEFKLMDKYMKVRVRYTGDKLVLILAATTKYNILA